MQITHEVREPWRVHLQTLQARLLALDAHITRLKAQQHDAKEQQHEAERDLAAVKLAANNLVVLLGHAADFPKDKLYTLSQDGTTITCEAEEPKA